MQIISYFRHHSTSDPALMKWTVRTVYPTAFVLLTAKQVAVLWLLESVHFGNTIYGVHYYLVVNYNNPTALVNVIWAPAVNLGLLVGGVFSVLSDYELILSIGMRSVPCTP